MSLEDKITRLTEFWYKYVSMDHHKDRDCHFSITKEWSYGSPPHYTVTHNGYVGHEIETNTNTEEHATRILYNEIVLMLRKEKAGAKKILSTKNSYDEYQIKQAEFIIKFYPLEKEDLVLS